MPRVWTYLENCTLKEDKMTPEQFCYWLQGMLEGNPNLTKLSKDQTQIIKDHLETVFTKVTPTRTRLVEGSETDIESLRKSLEKNKWFDVSEENHKICSGDKKICCSSNTSKKTKLKTIGDLQENGLPDQK